ncbi:hypothetical protein TARUN_1082 [Trichoderma arundinaceum]|uniref:Zn(2)-C6 fungal-type domain-containing protein n=1 Tax=Trichoderma arundinaceum TaxID=490622 RepID=A0A395NYH8_TRIAR|nr:hypothetical protein TARUN_1082 [Trichoderma arundinaceum]
MSGKPLPPRKYRRLAAKPSGASNNINSLFESNTAPPTPSPEPSPEPTPEPTLPSNINPEDIRPVRTTINVACESCRRRKTRLIMPTLQKCDGNRPKCSGCATRQLDCHYSSANRSETISAALKRKYREEHEKSDVFEELFTALKSCPETDAMTMFSLVRQGVDPGSLLRRMKDCDLLLQLSVIPETRRRYQFPYLASMPTHLQTPDNPYLKSLLYETAFRGIVPGDGYGSGQGEAQPSPPEHGQLGQYENIYLQPYHAAEVVDPLIDHVQPSKWTSISADDHLMRTLLRAYILHEYPTFPVFHKDIFLQAMIDEDTRYCSPMLVNVLLAEACHSFIGIPNRDQFWVPQSLRYRFLAEAKRLWEQESDSVDLVTVQAATLLNLVYSHNGMDKVGHPYLLRALDVAQQLELFGDHANEKNERMKHARVFTAWALFNWQCMELYLATILFSSKQAGVSRASTLMKETAQKTAAHAAARLETVARLYYIRHSFEHCDPFLTIHLSFVAGAALDGLAMTPANDKETIRSLRSTVILSLKGLYDQGQHIHLTSVIYRLLRDRLGRRDLALLQKYVVWDPLTPEEPLLLEYAQSHYPLTMGKKDEDPDSARLDNLVKKYEQLTTEESQ